MEYSKLMKDKKGVFGLNSVQAFFAIILGIALLAYIIVVIMGVLGDNTILSQLSTTIVNETGSANTTGYTLSASTILGFNSPSITKLYNRSSGAEILVANASVSSIGVVTNGSVTEWNNVSITYTYNYNSIEQNSLNSILSNTSTGVTGFFDNISPVYAILAVLVIILVLVVLVRVVQSPKSSGQVQSL